MSEKLENLAIFKRFLFIFFPLFFILLFLNKTGLEMIAGVLVIGILYAFFRDRLWYLLIICAPSLVLGKVLFFPITDSWVYEAQLAEAILGLVAVVFLIDLYLNNRLALLVIDKLSFFLFLFLTLSALSVMWSSDMRLFIFALKTPAFAFLGYTLALNLLDTPRKRNYFLYSLALTAIMLSAQIFYRFYTMGFSSEFFFNRSNILIPLGPIATAAALLALIAPALLGLYFSLRDTKPWKPIVFLGFFAAFLAVFLSLGKGAIASLFFGLFIIFCLHRNKRLAYLLFFLWFLALAYFGFQPYFSGLFERVRNTFVDVNTQFRVTEYQLSLDLIRENPWQGIGIGQQIHSFEKMLDQEQGNLINNFLIQTMVDLGIAGLVLGLIIMKELAAKIFAVIYRQPERTMLAAGLSAAFITAFFNGLVEVTIYALPYAIVFWMMAGVFEKSYD